MAIPAPSSSRTWASSGDGDPECLDKLAHPVSIVSWNAPVSLASMQIVPALQAGNTVVVKAPETCPLALLRTIGLVRAKFHPARLDMREVIRTVADKGGGAHVDANASPALRYMYERAPSGHSFAELFVIAIGRYVQHHGERLLGGKGCRVSQELLVATHHKYNLLVAAHQDFTET